MGATFERVPNNSAPNVFLSRSRQSDLDLPLAIVYYTTCELINAVTRVPSLLHWRAIPLIPVMDALPSSAFKFLILATSGCGLFSTLLSKGFHHTQLLNGNF